MQAETSKGAANKRIQRIATASTNPLRWAQEYNTHDGIRLMKINKINNFVLYTGVALLMTHELDAVMNKEWLVLPLTNWLNSEVGYAVFLWSHVPLFFVILALLSSSSERLKMITATVLAAFLVVHAGLHLVFADHQHYAFASTSSNLLIYSGALFGAVYFGIRHKISKRA